MNSSTRPQNRIKLKAIVQEFDLKPFYEPPHTDDIYVVRPDVSRPGLPLAGFYKDFENERIQLIGNMENSYLESLSPEARYKSLDTFFSQNLICLILTNGIVPYPEMLSLAEKYKVPLYSSSSSTSDITAAMNNRLHVMLAERITVHGVLVEVYGEGVLILGDSGIGKSETAIELVKRGHRLIADDSVDIKKVSTTTLVGEAPELIRHYIELRGIGIVDVSRIFGMGSVKNSEKIELIINFEHWEPGKEYERLGLDEITTEIMGISVPSITVPVQPGRNLAVIIEIAAMNNRQKKMGYNAAAELNKKIISYDK